MSTQGDNVSSYQDLESRLAVIERKVEFVMSKMQLQITGPTGLVDAAGQPQVVTRVQSLLDLYRAAEAQYDRG